MATRKQIALHALHNPKKGGKKAPKKADKTAADPNEHNPDDQNPDEQNDQDVDGNEEPEAAPAEPNE